MLLVTFNNTKAAITFDFWIAKDTKNAIFCQEINNSNSKTEWEIIFLKVVCGGQNQDNGLNENKIRANTFKA